MNQDLNALRQFIYVFFYYFLSQKIEEQSRRTDSTGPKEGTHGHHWRNARSISNEEQQTPEAERSLETTKYVTYEWEPRTEEATWSGCWCQNGMEKCSLENNLYLFIKLVNIFTHKKCFSLNQFNLNFLFFRKLLFIHGTYCKFFWTNLSQQLWKYNKIW